MWQDLHTVDWQGEAADAERARAGADKDKVRPVAADLRVGARIAREGASNELVAQSSLRYAVEDAWDAGCNVYDDYTVKDAGTAVTVEEQAARQAQAEALAGNIRHQAVRLVSLDQQIGERITATTASVRTLRFEEGNGHHEVLRNLLRRIEDANNSGDKPLLVSHAWTDGPMMYLVYLAPPSDITRGLVRDTRESLFDPAGGPWLDVRDAVIYYYYACDLDESQPWGSFRKPGEPDTIRWDSYPLEEGLPERLSDIPDEYRYTPPPRPPSAKRDRGQTRRVVSEPRRYVDPRELNTRELGH
jgi:hypothetical protein